MEKIVIFCKSYKKDIYRAKRLAESIDRFNTDSIAFFMSVPSNDLNEFKEKFGHIPCNFFTDEIVLKKTSQDFGNVPSSFPNHLLQQLVKLEFWRMDLYENYVWVDSDSYFIRNFSRSDFFMMKLIHTRFNMTLKTFVILLQGRVEQKLLKILKKWQKNFKIYRTGPVFISISVHLGPSPVIWSTRVLKSLHEEYLPKKQNHI